MHCLPPKAHQSSTGKRGDRLWFQARRLAKAIEHGHRNSSQGSEPIRSRGSQALGQSHGVANPLHEYHLGTESIAVHSASALVHKWFAIHVPFRPTESLFWVGRKSTGSL
jgi:hypothetical protein